MKVTEHQSSRITTYAYDDEGRVEKVSSYEGIIEYEYVETGRLRETRTGDHRKTYDYDKLGRLSVVRHWDEQDLKGTYTYQYDEVGLWTHLEYAPELAPAVVTSWEYDLLGRLNTLTHREGKIQAPGDVLTKYTYEHRKDGRRSRMTEWREGNPARDVSYAYDALNRLILEESEFSGQSQHDYTHEYAFDLVGNRFSKTVDSGSPTLYYYDGDHGLNDRLTGDSSGVSYHYDDNGFLTSKVDGTTTEMYDANVEGRLASYHNGYTGINVSYRYDHRGIRTEATADFGGGITQHRRYLIDHHNHTGYAQILKELEGASSPTLVRSYTIGDDVLAQQAGSALHVLIQDGHGSTAGLWRALDGQVEQHFGYDAYGNGLDFPSQPLTEILYAGEQRDQDLGWYYLRARYYDPANGRFNRMDPYWGSPNDPLTLHKYAYCHADPVNGWDPTGLFTLTSLLTTSTLQNVIRSNVAMLRTLHTIYQTANNVSRALELFHTLRAVSDLFYAVFAAATAGGSAGFSAAIVSAIHNYAGSSSGFAPSLMTDALRIMFREIGGHFGEAMERITRPEMMMEMAEAVLANAKRIMNSAAKTQAKGGSVRLFLWLPSSNLRSGKKHFIPIAPARRGRMAVELGFSHGGGALFGIGLRHVDRSGRQKAIENVLRVDWWSYDRNVGVGLNFHYHVFPSADHNPRPIWRP